MAPTAGGDEVSQEARMVAGRVRERAESFPDAAEIAGLVLDRNGGDMGAAEIRQLAEDAIRQAQQVSYLLGKLAALLETPDGDPG